MKTNNYFHRVFTILFLLGITLQQAFSQFKTVGYFPSWQGTVSQIQFSKLTHINYSFLLPTSTGGLQPIENPSKLQSLVSSGHAAGVKVLIAVGGWNIGAGGGNDGAFETLAANPSYRTNFVNNLVNFVNQYGLDGVDVDWEYPDPGASANNYAALMLELSNAMHSRGKLLSAAVVAHGYTGGGVLNSVFGYVDFLNLMAYDENGFQHSTYNYAVQSLNYWIGRGLPKNKAILGVPFYGRDSWESFAQLVARGADPYADVYGNVGYNGITTIKNKTNLAFDQGGGIMIWELSHDATGNISLLTAINQVVVSRNGTTNTPPTVSVSSPANGSVYTTGANVSITANATDANGSVTKVEFFVDGVKISEDLTSPYTATYTAAAGNHSLTARATDNAGAATTSAAVSITVNNPTNTPPTVSISSPANGSTYTTGANVSISANAADANGTVTKVEFFVDGVKISEDLTSPYTATYSAAAGNHSLTARATDNAGAATTSAAVSITVHNTTVTNTPYGGTVRNIPGRIEAEHYDLGGQGVAYNDLTAGNSGAAFRTDAVDIEASTDAGGGYNVGWVATGEWLKYTVNVTTAGTYNMQFRVAAIAAGKYFHLEMNDQNVTGTISVPNTGGWQAWTTVTVSNISLTAGQKIMKIVMDSPEFNINYVDVVSTTTTNTPPTVSITSPANGSTYTTGANVSISANAADANGTVTKVEFFVDGVKISEDITSPYTATYSNATAGNHTLTARATDNAGAATTSAGVGITVNTTTNTPPTVSISSPANGSTYTAGANVSITANAADANGTVSKVEFFVDGVKISEDLTSPYTATYSNATAGNHTLTARATDNAGATTTSAALSITVNAPSGTCSVAAWSSTKIYVNGDQASQNGKIYRAKWWTQGDSPALSGQWDVWALIGTCGGARMGTASYDQTSAEAIEVYPNPTAGTCVVKLNLQDVSNAEITVINSLGVQVYSSALSNGNFEEIIDLQGMDSGIYFIRINADGKEWNEKVMKQ